jgi:hypothetical protein
LQRLTQIDLPLISASKSQTEAHCADTHTPVYSPSPSE